MSSKEHPYSLPVDTCGKGASLLFQKLRAYSRAFGSGNLVALPSLSARPLLEEHASLTVGCGQHDERPTRDGEHRSHRKIELVSNPGGLVQYQECRPAKAPNGLLRAWQRLNARAVLELHPELTVALSS
jgi:hypothetical protein